ncbi:MAG: hypothetical protein ACLPPF_20500 [Rhodomicrobium sp.]
MALTPSDITEIDALLGAPEADSGTLANLRARFPKLSLTRVDSSDMGVETPFRQYKLFDLYLVDGGGHCWSITNDPGHATGLVIAARGVPA